MREHSRAAELLPWMVNGTLAGPDAAWLDVHLEGCATCRAELVVQRRVRDAIARESTVQFAPQASFNRLWKRIEAEAAEPAAPAPATGVGAAPARRVAPAAGRPGSWVRVALAAQAAVILVLCGVLWQRPGTGAYRTVTDAAPGAVSGQPVVKAIFDDQVRLADVKEILAGAGLVVASGPSEAGVYTLVTRDARSPSIPQSVLARLRADPRVRFAEADAQ
jgi:Putative zinc-finger